MLDTNALMRNLSKAEMERSAEMRKKILFLCLLSGQVLWKRHENQVDSDKTQIGEKIFEMDLQIKEKNKK